MFSTPHSTLQLSQIYNFRHPPIAKLSNSINSQLLSALLYSQLSTSRNSPNFSTLQLSYLGCTANLKAKLKATLQATRMTKLKAKLKAKHTAQF